MDLGPGAGTTTVKQFVKDALDYKHSFVWKAALIMIGFVLWFLAIFTFAIKKFNFSKR